MDASHRKSPLSKRRGRPGFSPSPLSPSLSPQASSVRPRRRLLRPRADEPALPVRFAPARKILGKKKEKKKFRSLELVDPAAWRSRRCPRPSFSSLLKPRAKYPEEADGEELGVEEVPVADHLGHAGPALLHRVPRGPRPGPQRRTRPSRTFRAGLGNSSEEERQSFSFNRPRARRPPRGMEVEALPAAGAAAELGGGALGELADGDLPELRPGGAEPALPPAPAKAVSRRQSLTDITNRDHDADPAPPCGGDPPPPPEDLAPPAMAPGQVSSPSPPRPAGSCAPPRERTVHGRGRDEVEGGERPALPIEARSTTPRVRCPRPPRSSPSGRCRPPRRGAFGEGPLPTGNTSPMWTDPLRSPRTSSCPPPSSGPRSGGGATVRWRPRGGRSA